MKGRALLSGIDKVEEWGVSGDLLWSYSSGGTGPYVKFSPEWGATNDRREDLWERGVSELDFSGDSSGRRYVMEAGYGVSVFGEIMTFFARNEIEDGEATSQSGGVDIETTGGLRAGYEAVSRTSGRPEHRGYLRYGGEF
ncbi:MAG: hypothetical protein OXF52_03055 [Candidatus Dadabacteria bacterium]|nr:hypothetical protein [Candidatus Dadabacteria bacterium]